MTIHDDPRFSAAADGDLETFRKFGDETLALLSLFVEHSRAGEGRVLRQTPLPQLVRELELDRWIRRGGMDGATYGRFLERYLADCTRLNHPSYMGHQVAVPLFPSALADLVHGMLNNGMAVYEMGSAGVAVETAVVDWMLAKVGWRPEAAPFGERLADARAGGVLTHGGSLANLTALLAARAAAAPDAWKEGVPRDLAVLAPAASHYSIARAVSILGLGSDALLPIDVDRLGRMDPAGLERAYEEAVGTGRRVIAVVANACNTPAGVYDALEPAADFCDEHELWLHVDGAHGASALLSPDLRGRLAGLERAHSIVWDAHKMLGASTLCAAVLVRDVAWLTGAFRQEGSYLVADRADGPGPDLLGRTLECTKGSIGLKLFLVLALHGEDGLRRHVEVLHERARAAHATIHARPGFATACTPESNIVLFRHEASDDGRHAAIRSELVRTGEFYITQTELGGRLWLRLVLMNPLTDAAVVERLLDQVEALSA
jgi:L-2,4-diaminobutyrate decarboxylase